MRGTRAIAAGGRPERLRLAGAGLLLAAALAYLLRKSLFSHDPESDFRFLWTAGRMWAAGADPYGDGYTATGARLFPDGNPIAYWLYPPQWWAICRALAALPVAQALALWRTANALLLVGAGVVLVRAARRAGLAVPAWGALLYLALLPLAEGTPQTLAMGQTSILVFAGLSLVASALLDGSGMRMIGGLVLLGLKPQFGAAVLLALAVDRRWWRAIALALAISLAAALPQLVAHGVGPTVAGFLHNLARHGALPPNQPEKLTGFTQIVVRATGVHVPTGLSVALAVLTGAAAVLWWRRRAADPARSAAGTALALVAASMAFIPLHSYDFVALPPAALLAVPFGLPARITTWAGILLACRAGALAGSLGARDTGDIALLTLAAALVLAGALLALRDRPAPAR